jgi:hypothetical protein
MARNATDKEGEKVRETYIVYESLERANSRRGVSTGFPVGYQRRKEAAGAKVSSLILLQNRAIARFVSTKSFM